jgi:hypothetical protein
VIVSELFIEIIKIIFGAILQMFLVATGEAVLFVVTLGQRKPRWDLYTNENFGRFFLFTELSEWVGITFWIATIALIVNHGSK